MGVSLRTNLPLENHTSITMSPIHMSEAEELISSMPVLSAMPVLGDQDFNSFNLDEGILQNPDQHIGDIEEMFRSMDEQKLSIYPEIEAEDFEDHGSLEVYDSRVADYMWNGMDVKSSATRSLVKTNVVVSSRPRSLLRCNFVAPAPPPVTFVTQCLSDGGSDGGSDFSEESSRPETPPSDSDDALNKVDSSVLPGYEDFSATHSVWSRNYVPESAFIHSNDDEYANVQAVPLSEVTGQIIKRVYSTPTSSTSTAASNNWIKSEPGSPGSPVSPASPGSPISSSSTTSCASSPVSMSPILSSPMAREPRDAAAIAAATSNLFNDHSYPLNRNGYPGIPGNLTPSESEDDEIDVVNVVKTRPSRSSATLPNNPTANDRKVLQRTVASKISPPPTPAASPAPSPPPSPPRRTPAIMSGPSLNQMRPDGALTLVRTKRECMEAITWRRRREVKAYQEDDEHVRRLRQLETGFVPQPAPAPIRKEVKVLNHGMVMPSASEVRPDWLVVCHNKRDRFRKSRARIEQDAWQNVQSVRKKHRQKQALAGRRAPIVAPMSDLDSDEDSSSSRRGRGSNSGRGSKRKLKRDLDSEERRSQHNHMERRRRVDLRESFEELRVQIPMNDGKAAKVAILEGAANRIKCLQNVEEQLLDEEDRLLKEYFSLRVRLLRLTLPPRMLEGWSDNDLIMHEVASAAEKMEAAEGVSTDAPQNDQEEVDEEVGVDDDLDEDSEEEEVMLRTPAPKRRRTRHRDSDSEDDEDDFYYR